MWMWMWMFRRCIIWVLIILLTGQKRKVLEPNQTILESRATDKGSVCVTESPFQEPCNLRFYFYGFKNRIEKFLPKKSTKCVLICIEMLDIMLKQNLWLVYGIFVTLHFQSESDYRSFFKSYYITTNSPFRVSPLEH